LNAPLDPDSRRSLWPLVLAATAFPTIAATVLYLVVPDPRVVHLEGGIIERSQLVGWVVAAALAAFLAIRTRERRTAAAIAWRGILAVLLLARELDLHEALNPEMAGAFGVRYRLDWWLDPSTPFQAKLLWMSISGAVAALLLMPVAAAREPPLRLLSARDPAMWLTAIAFALFGAGWMIDDVLRGILEKHSAKAAEELVELYGVGCYVASVVACFERTWQRTSSAGDDVGRRRPPWNRRQG